MYSELSREVLETRVSEGELSVGWVEVVKAVTDFVDGVGFVVRGEEFACKDQTI